MTEKQTHTEPSQEYRNFEAGLKQVLSVSKPELDRRLKADKEQRDRKKAAPSDTK